MTNLGLHLGHIDLETVNATLLGNTGVHAAYGLAWTGEQLMALGNFGAMATVDPTTGAPQRTHHNVIDWSGAATAP